MTRISDDAYYIRVLRLFSTRRNFPRAAQFFFVCELSGKTNLKKTKKNCAARGKFRLVENSLYSGTVKCKISKYFMLPSIEPNVHF